MFNNLLNRAGLGVALFFMVLELAYVNAKSLLYIVDEFGIVDKVFAIIGAIAFSMVTVIVMRKGSQKWLKIVFPLFDCMLVFCGFNLKFADKLTSNPVALSLTIFMAVFTGLITYSLGIINNNELSKTDSNKYESELLKLKSEFNLLTTDFNNLQTEYNKLSTDYCTESSELQKTKSELAKVKEDAKVYKAGFFAAERSRILKKNEKNRTPEEVLILNATA